MNLFQSDNIWKRKMREEKAVRNPPSAHAVWEQELRSNSLWLVGGLIVVIGYLVCLVRGSIALSLTSGAVVVVVSIYCGMTALKLRELKKQEPPRDPAGKKKASRRK